MTSYTGPTMRGVDYSPTWPGWLQGNPNSQTFDSDFANDAVQSLWSDKFKGATGGDKSVPHDNSPNYRNDLGHISSHRFKLVRLYNWNMARGASSTAGPAPGHLNFLTYAENLGLKVVVPVSDYFLNDDQYSWNNTTPDDSYSFASAPQSIQTDFNLFISSITDPRTGKIHAAVHSIAVGNEGEIGEGGLAGKTTASNFLARTIWWIYNLHLQINGTGANGPNGLPVVNGPSPVVLLTATISNADQGQPSTGSYWFKCFSDGAQKGQQTPLGTNDGNLGSSFDRTVPGIKQVDSSYANYHYNSVNIGQSTTQPPFGNSLAETLQLYDTWPGSGWPGAQFTDPLLLMEVFTPDRTIYPEPRNQAEAAVNQVKAMEEYLITNSGGGPRSTTQFMGYNYFQFNDEPHVPKYTGLYQYPQPAGPTAQTGTTVIPYGPWSFPNMTFPVCSLTAAMGPSGPNGPSLIDAIKAYFPPG
jgi:hypothetical protein